MYCKIKVDLPEPPGPANSVQVPRRGPPSKHRIDFPKAARYRLADVVDAFSLNYRVILAEEGCFDHTEASHAVSLCDMHAKYADVVPTSEILSYIDQLAIDLFDLPTGSNRSATPG
jgi:hypothetical protein